MTTVPSGIVTVTGFGGGGGGGGAGAAGRVSAAAVPPLSGPGLFAESGAGVAGAGAGAATGTGAAAGFLRSGFAWCSGRGAGSAAAAAICGAGAAVVVRSTTVFTPGVFVAICSAASRAPSSDTCPVNVTTPFCVETSTLEDFNDASEYKLALIAVVMESSLRLLLHAALNSAKNKNGRNGFLWNMTPPVVLATANSP